MGSLGRDWLRSRMPPEAMEIKEGWLSGSEKAVWLLSWHSLRLALTLFILKDDGMIVLQLPAFPN